MMGSYPANNRLDILNLGRPGRLVHHPVRSRDKKVAVLGHVQAKTFFERRAVGGAPPGST